MGTLGTCIDFDVYAYEDDFRGDLLTHYKGTNISYDNIGNPSNWRNAQSLTWNGRNLTNHAVSSNENLQYSYDSSGIRTRKYYINYSTYTLHDHTYVLDGTKIIKETIQSDVIGAPSTNELYYYYDETGVAGFELNGTVYYYLKNIQGDVINILNASGQVVVTYSYDAWGKVLSVTGTLASSVGQFNPFRYRSYYYDTETGFYYLQTRYYDPEVGRFLNADGIIGANGGIQGYNMFVYCNNNPVMFSDPLGLCPHDGKLYKDGPYKGLPEYYPCCEKCQAHGSYELSSDSYNVVFYNATKRIELMHFIAGWETLSETPKGGCIGFGTVISQNRQLLKDVLGTDNPTSITEAEAYTIMNIIINYFDNFLLQYHFDFAIQISLDARYALFSIAYTTGADGLNKIIPKLMNSNDSYSVFTSFSINDNDNNVPQSKGLIKRRNAEWRIYVYGIYDSTH